VIPFYRLILLLLDLLLLDAQQPKGELDAEVDGD